MLILSRHCLVALPIGSVNRKRLAIRSVRQMLDEPADLKLSRCPTPGHVVRASFSLGSADSKPGKENRSESMLRKPRV
jgi:hypothetical protein